MFFNVAVLSWGFNCTVLLCKKNLVFIVASNIFIKIYHPIKTTSVFYLKLHGVLFIVTYSRIQFEAVFNLLKNVMLLEYRY